MQKNKEKINQKKKTERIGLLGTPAFLDIRNVNSRFEAFLKI